MEPLIIRKAMINLYALLALSVAAIALFIYIFYGDFTLITIGIIAVFSLFPGWLFIYALRELIRKTPHMTFTEEGLLIKAHHFYAWENIDDFTFGIEEVGRDNAGSIYKNYITLLLKDGSAAKVPVSHLDRKAEEIMYLLGEYKRSSADAQRPLEQ
ncbi:hypothetical protein [Pedobacter sp. FW305-3-2-15-E-R2A2]|jgi:hypothetical protein|uniref:hypothetical protein n=1 Tax=Pedobacter sp. FW305-3-2-15-E-R2A2 TaxID=3140251 RepID=UPI0031405651